MSPSGSFRPTSAGAATITAAAQGIAGTATVQVVKDLMLRIGTNNPSYHFGQAPRGALHLAFQDGAPVQNVVVTLTFSKVAPSGVTITPGGVQPTAGGPTLQSATITGRTNNFGDLLFQAPAGFDQPGSYRIDAAGDWAGNHGAGSTTYNVDL
jgi:hypothetical protein